MRGRKPKPTELKLLAGNPGGHRSNESEPQFTAGAPDPPEWLSPAARAEWDRVAPELARLGLLARVDLAALAAYCQCYAHYVEAERFIQEHGLTLAIRDDKGVLKSVQPVPEVGISLKMLDKIRQFAAEFGFSPSARGRIEVKATAAGGGDEKEKLREAIKVRIARLEKAVGGAGKAG
jgi:P27 family predicted phage terminase small subunit